MSDTTPLFPFLAVLQFPIDLAEPAKNLDKVRAGLESLNPTAGTLIVLPEMWPTGFAYGRYAELAADTDRILGELAGLAGRYDCLLAGSQPELVVGARQSHLYNTLYVVGTAGILGAYRKQQIFVFGGEGEAFTAGSEPRPIVTPWGRIGCLVCYDLRFPQLARSQCQQGADLLICSAQWPALRREQWRVLLRARAMENQTFLVASNGCGTVDGVDLGGCSAIIDPEGEVLFEAGDESCAEVRSASWQVRQAYRTRFNSFAVASYPFDDAAKICDSAADCLALVSARKAVGQRLVYCAVGRNPCGTDDLEALQQARRQGDFLLVGLLPAEADDPEGQGEADRSAGRIGDILRSLAALGCVDAVCSLEDFSAEDLLRLGELLAD